MVAILQKLATIWETQTIVKKKKGTSGDLKELRKVEPSLFEKYYNEGALFTPQAKPRAKITHVCLTIQIQEKS